MIPSGGTVSPTPAPPSFSNTKSLAFDGVDEWVSLGVIDDLNGGISAFSTSTWFKYDGTLGTGSHMILSGGTGVTDRFYIQLIANNTLRYAMGGGFDDVTITTLSAGTWYNLITVQNGADVDIYLNGSLQGSFTDQIPTSNIGTIVKIGNYITGSYYWDGNIDEVAIWNSDQTANISTIYNSGTPNNLSDLNPLAWYRCGDNSTYQTPQILMPENTNKDKLSNYSLTFDAVDDVITFLTITFDATNGLTLSCWVKYTTASAGGSLNWLCSNGGTGGTSSQFNHRLVSDGSWFTYFNGSPQSTGINGLNDGNWHHIAQTVNYSNGDVKFYKDGVESATVLTWGSTYSTAKLQVIGAATSGAAFPYGGYVDEFAVFESIKNISELYNGGEPTTISGSTAYWKLGEQSKFTDNWLVPNSALNNYSKYSFNFDGVDDYIVCSYDSSLNVVTANHSLSFWIKTTDGTTQVVCEKGSGDELAAWITTSKITWAGPNTFSSTSTINDGNWHHIGFVADGLNSYIYIDGSLDNTGGNKIQASANFSPFVFGARSGGSFAFLGNLDELAIFNYALSSDDINTIYNGGEPTTIPSGAVAHWRMGENATYNSSTSEWTIPDQVGSNDGTSTNTMALDTLVGEAPNYFGGGVSDAMTIEDRVGDAPNSSNNSVSFNMEAEDINNNVPT
jgi:hypothetical protein